MRFVAPTLALVALLQCFAFNTAGADELILSDVAAKKAVEELVGVPLDEFLKDSYDVVFRKKGGEALRRLRYRLAKILGNKDALALSQFLIDKLKDEIFNGRVNREMFDSLAMELYFALKDFFKNTPEDPMEAADLGAWHALVNLYKEVMGPALRGSNRVTAMNELLLDPDLSVIRKWIKEFKSKAEKAAEAAADNASNSSTASSSTTEKSETKEGN